MASVQTLGPVTITIAVASNATQIQAGSLTGNNVAAFLLQNQSSVTIYIGNSTVTGSLGGGGIQIAAGASYNPDKHQTRDDRQNYGLDNYYVASGTATLVTAVVMYHTIANRH